MDPARVTIGVPVYNGERYLDRTLASLTGQDSDGVDLEIVVSDNGSTDATADICRTWAAKDERVRVVRAEQNRGAAWNYNRVLALAETPLFKWAAADDVCEPSFVRRCVDELRAGGPDAVLAYPQTILIDSADAPIGPLDDADLDLRDPSPVRRLDTLLQHRVEWHPVFGVIRTDVLRRTRGIGRYPSADVVLLAELALRGRFLQVREPLFLRRYHDERSIVAGPSFHEQVTWYDPGLRPRFVLPQARLVRELLTAVRTAPLMPRDRAAAVGAVLRRWALPHWRHIGGEVKLAGRRELARLRAGR